MPNFRLVLQGRDIALTPGVLVIGRGEKADLILVGPTISRRHAMLRITNEGVSIEDLESSNGVIVNERRISGRTVLKHQDCIKIGFESLFLVKGTHAEAESIRQSGQSTMEFKVPDEANDTQEYGELGADDATINLKGTFVDGVLVTSD